jgi:hypothetical protein
MNLKVQVDIVALVEEWDLVAAKRVAELPPYGLKFASFLTLSNSIRILQLPWH